MLLPRTNHRVFGPASRLKATLPAMSAGSMKALHLAQRGSCTNRHVKIELDSRTCVKLERRFLTIKYNLIVWSPRGVRGELVNHLVETHE